MNDMLDDLLDASAPAPLRISDADARTMIAQARDEARPAQPRAKRAAIATGVLAVLMVGGAGVATAADLFPWTQEQEDPYVAVDFELPSGLSCEQRIFVIDAENPLAADWLRQFASDNDLLALADVDGYLERMEGWGDTGGSEDLRQWRAINGALWEAALTQAEKAGFDSGALTGMQAQTYCTDDSGDVVVPR